MIVPINLIPVGIAIVLVIFSVIGLLVLKAASKWSMLSRLPHPTSSSSVLGSLELIQDVDHIPQTLGKVANDLGGICSVQMLGISSVIVTDPEIFQELLTLQKDPWIYRIMSCIVSPDGNTPNMLSHPTNDGYWKKIRKCVLPSFSMHNLRREFPQIVQVIGRVEEYLTTNSHNEGGGPSFVNIDNVLQRQALDVMGFIGFGTDFGSVKHLFQMGKNCGGARQDPHLNGDELKNKQGGKDFYSNHELFQGDIFELFKAATLEVTLRANSAFRHRLRHFLPSARKGSRDLLAVQARMMEFLKEIRQKYDNTIPPDNDVTVAAQLLRLKGISDLQLAGEFTLFLYAGFETTGHAMSWTLYLLCRNRSSLEEVLDQLDQMEILKTYQRPNPRKLCFDDLSKLQQGALGRCIKESMRMIPVVSGGSARYTPVQMKLRGYDIPAHTTFFLLTHGMHNSPKLWHDPDRFLPDRWKMPKTELWIPDQNDYCNGKICDCKVQKSEDSDDNRINNAYQMIEGENGSLNCEQYQNEHEYDSKGTSSTMSSQKASAKKFLPFSGGIRSCIGQNLAQINMLATLAILLSKFDLKIPEELDSLSMQMEIQRSRITTFPDWKGQGLPMRCIPR